VIVPNGKLAQVVVRNESIVTETVATEIELWLAHESDEIRALDVLADEAAGTSATIKEVTFEGTVLTVSGPHVTPIERPLQEAALRRDCPASAAKRGPALARLRADRKRTRTRLSE
jgi:hypothetical protein